MNRKALVVLLLLVCCAASICAEAVSEKAQEPRIGIISAMANEVSLLLANAEIDRVEEFGGFEYNIGTLCGREVVIVQAGVGKVLSASCATVLVGNYRPSCVIFTGIAGGVGNDTQVLDTVVADKLIQHDFGFLDNEGFVWGLSEGGEVDYSYCDERLVGLARESAAQERGQDHVFVGTIVSGDQFIASEWYVKDLQNRFDAVACEMEGAAVGLVCSKFDVPFVVIRVMSDKADGLAHESINNMGDLAADISSTIVMDMLPKI